MSSAVTGKGVPVKGPRRLVWFGSLRFVRMAVAFVVVAGSLGLATVTATAQSGGSSCPSDGADNYSDVTGGTHADDIACLRELGISEAGDTYRPDDDMTRSEMAAFMANTYAALTGMEAPVEDHMFADVEGDPNADDIARISPNGLMITTGTSDTTYSPNNPVVRGHMALFLTRLYKAVTGSDAPAGDTPFTDIGDRPDGEQAAIGQIYALEVTTGTSDTTYSPGNNVTRAQMASFVARMYQAIDALAEAAEAPGAPTGVTVAVSGDAGDALDVSWTAPEEDGGADVTGYVVQWKSGDDDYSADNQRSVDGTSSNFDGLTQGTAYTFRVAAVNDAGQSEWSDDASASPGTAPGAVGDLAVTAGNKTLSVTWSAPDDGGTPITGYTVAWRAGREDGEEATVGGDALGYTITLQDNQIFDSDGTTRLQYRVSVTATNAAGDGPTEAVAPSESTATTPTATTKPSSVTLVFPAPNADGTTDDTMIHVAWTAPTDLGGRTIVQYEYRTRSTSSATGVTSDWSDWTEQTPATTIVQSVRLALANIGAPVFGDTVEVQVRADNTDDADDPAGEPDPGVSDPESGSVTLTTAPAAPTLAQANVRAGHQSIQLEWTPPASNGSPITGYKVSYSSGGAPTEVLAGADATTHLFTGLTNGAAYTVTVKAVNAQGDGPASTGVTVTPLPAPAAPSNLKVVVPPQKNADNTDNNDGQKLDVSWDAPADNGTASMRVSGTAIGPVTGYVVVTRTSAIPAPEDPTMSATCPTGGSAQVGRACSAGDLTELMGFAATDFNTDRKVTLTGLQTGFSYDVFVQSVNGDATVNRVGVAAVASATPANVPSNMLTVSGGTAVPILSVENGYRLLIASWAPPDSNGSDITHYMLRYAENTVGDEHWTTVRVPAQAPLRPLTGLKSDTNYVVQVRAVNAIGEGEWTDSVDGTTGGYPSAPTNVKAVPEQDGDGTKLTVTWNRVTSSNGGGPLSGYQIEYRRTAAAANGSPSALSPDWIIAGAANDNEFPCDDPDTGTIADPDVEACDTKATKATLVVAGNPGDTYAVRVRATSGTATVGSSGYALPVKTASVPDSPTSVEATYHAATKAINVTWGGLTGEPAKAISSYLVTWTDTSDTVSGDRGSRTIADGTASNLAIKGLGAGTYTVTVQAVNAIGKSSLGTTGSPVATVTGVVVPRG